MKEIVIIIVLISSITAKPAATGDNSNGSLAISPAIIDGKETEKINYWEVAIVTDADAQSSSVSLCSGVLIRTEWVLTSAFCVSNKNVLRVLLGSPTVEVATLGQTGILVDISKIIIHPSYNPTYLLHDIALLNVKGAYNADSVTLAALPKNPTSLNEYVGESGLVSGYGIENNTYIPTDTYKLRNKPVQIRDNRDCARVGQTMNNYKLCSNGRYACSGDEGGPLTINNQVVGIISIGLDSQNCEGKLATTYTRVNYYNKWIQQTISSYCKRC